MVRHGRLSHRRDAGRLTPDGRPRRGTWPYIVHLPLVVTVQDGLAGRGLSAAGAWAVVCVLVVPVSFLLAAGLRRLPGFRRVL
ncbi:MAG: hypothetical protein ACJ736_06050 [Streptomyces sp.]